MVSAGIDDQLSSMAFDGVRPPSITVYQGGRHQFECHWNLSMLDFWYHPSPAFERHRRSLTMFKCHRRHSTAFERVQRRECECYTDLRLLTIGLLVYTVKYGGTFWDRITSLYFVQYRIVSIVFPHERIISSDYQCTDISRRRLLMTARYMYRPSLLFKESWLAILARVIALRSGRHQLIFSTRH